MVGEGEDCVVVVVVVVVVPKHHPRRGASLCVPRSQITRKRGNKLQRETMSPMDSGPHTPGIRCCGRRTIAARIWNTDCLRCLGSHLRKRKGRGNALTHSRKHTKRGLASRCDWWHNGSSRTIACTHHRQGIDHKQRDGHNLPLQRDRPGCFADRSGCWARSPPRWRSCLGWERLHRTSQRNHSTWDTSQRKEDIVSERSLPIPIHGGRKKS